MFDPGSVERASVYVGAEITRRSTLIESPVMIADP
jgi:hypothetical protein